MTTSNPQLIDVEVVDENGNVYKVKAAPNVALKLQNDPVFADKVLSGLKQKGLKPSRVIPVLGGGESDALMMLANAVDLRSPPRKKQVVDIEIENAAFVEPKEEAAPSPRKSLNMNATVQQAAHTVSESSNDEGSVLFTNVPNDLEKDYFIFAINKRMRELGFLGRGEEAAFSCLENEKNQSVVVKFHTAKLAEDAILIESFMVCGKTVTATRVAEILSQPSVVIKNLPDIFDEDHFAFVLNKIVWDAGLLSSGEEAFLRFISRNAKARLAVVELKSTELANYMIQKGHFLYWGKTVTVSEHSPDHDEVLELGSKEPVTTSTTASAIAASQELSDCVGTTSRNDNRSPAIELSSHRGTVVFLRSLLKLRDSFRNPKNHPSAFAQLLLSLNSHGIDTSIADIMKKRKQLMDTYRRRKACGYADWAYFTVCGVIRGDLDMSALEGTEFDVAEPLDLNGIPKKTSTAMYTKGAVWTTRATRALIGAFVSHQHILKKPQRHSLFWQKVEMELQDRDFHYDAEQCESKMAELKKKYRDLTDQVKQTGSPSLEVLSQEWPYYEDMSTFMSKDVTVHPLLTVAVGIANKVEKNDTAKVQEKENHQLTPSKRRGKTRPASLRRPRPLKEQQLNNLHAIRKALMRRNKILEEAFACKLENSDSEYTDVESDS